MSKILGLDLGTNSIGWAVVEKENNNTMKLLDKGVHIFSEGVKIEKGVESSKAAERTKYRSARKIKYRRRVRKQNTLSVLIENGLCPLKKEELVAWRKNKKDYPLNDDFINWLRTDDTTNINPYYLRDKASRKKIAPLELGRALYHIAQRRGFLSNRLDQGSDGDIERVREEFLNIIAVEDNKEELIESLKSNIENYKEEEDKAVKKLTRSLDKTLKDNSSKPIEALKQQMNAVLNKTENLGAVKKGIKELTDDIISAGCETLGQYYYKCYKEGKRIRNRYTSREEHYLQEFNKICEVQEVSDELKEKLYNAIFYQRPLKSQKGLVGKCSFEKDKPRCPVSHPAFEEYRALQFINSIKASDENGTLHFLSKEEKEAIWSKFTRKSKPNFDFIDIANILTPKGTSRKFNYKNYVSVSGCPTIAQLISIFGENWKEQLYVSYKKRAKKNGEKTVDEVINDVWHVLFSYDNKEKLAAFARENLGLNDKLAAKFSAIVLKKDYASLSLKAINKISHFLREGFIYSYAVFLANMEKVVGSDIWNNETDRNLIISELKRLIDNHTEISKREGIVNDLIGNFRKHYSNSHKEYVLDEKDKREVKEKLFAAYGEKTFKSFSTTEQEEITEWIEVNYLHQLRKHVPYGEFMKPKRLDERIEDFLKDNFNVAEASLKKLYHPSDIETFKTPKRAEDGKLYLGSPMTSSIKNPLAMRTLHRLRKLVNTLVKEGVIDEDTVINIELARELNDANKRKAIQDYQKEREDNRKKYREEIKKLYKEQCGKDIEPSDTEVLKFELWEEQNHCCLYTGKSIGICDFIGADPKFDIEHTIPKSLSYDDSRANKTLCDIYFNRAVKKNKIPYELNNYNEIEPRLQKWKEKIQAYEKSFNSRKKARGTETKEQKDKRIRQKHYYKMHLDYWQNKLNRFTRKDVPEGFKNSQLVDTAIITKFSRTYLRSVFPKVHTVKGEVVAEFRKLWGLQDEYSKKERINHAHHTMDAITIACMTKDRYDALAQLYRADEENRTNEKKEFLKELKPWATFTEDVKALEQEILASHYTPDNVGKSSKKKWKKRGEVQKDKVGRPIYLKGDTVRGVLHQEKFYGAIAKDIDGNIEYDKNGNVVPKYVLRKEIATLSESDIPNIVDPEVRKIFEKAIEDKIITFKLVQNKKVAVLTTGKTIWRNEEKKIPIHKVRVYVSNVQNPLRDFKKHGKPFLSKHDYKQQFNVQNEDNYCIVLYEYEKERDFELINYYDYAKSKKESGTFYPANKIKVVKGKEQLLPVMNRNGNDVVLKKGTSVIFYEKGKELGDDVLKLDSFTNRFYQVEGISIHRQKRSSGKTYYYGSIKFRLHNEARKSDDLKKLDYQPDGEFKVGEYKPTRKMNHNQFYALVEGVDFKISPTGKIQKI